MRLVVFEGPESEPIRPGVLSEGGVVDITSATDGLAAHSPHDLMTKVIDSWDSLRPAFEALEAR